MIRAALLCAATLGLTACVAPRMALAPGAEYVAMGSSFAAGAGIGPLREGTPERCGRTPVNYAGLVAERLDLALRDASCGGATTAHVLGAWDELPPQIEAVGPDTRLVTITIGGNDVNYVGGLFAASCEERGMAERMGGTCPDFTAPEEAKWTALARDMDAIAAGVRRRAPGAVLVFVQYVGLVPEEPCASVPLTANEISQARSMAERLATITAETAARHDAILLPVHTMSQAHLPCSAVPWAKAFPEGDAGVGGAPWHPTAEGHRAIADALVARLQSL